MASIEEEGLFAYKTFRAYNLETTRFENLIQAEPNIFFVSNEHEKYATKKKDSFRRVSRKNLSAGDDKIILR